MSKTAKVTNQHGEGKGRQTAPVVTLAPRGNVRGPAALTASDVAYANGLSPAPHSYARPLADEAVDDMASDEVAGPVAKYASTLAELACDAAPVVVAARALLPALASYHRLQAAADRARDAVADRVTAVRKGETELAQAVRALPATHPLHGALAAFLARHAGRQGVGKRAANLRQKAKAKGGSSATPAVPKGVAT